MCTERLIIKFVKIHEVRIYTSQISLLLFLNVYFSRRTGLFILIATSSSNMTITDKYVKFVLLTRIQSKGYKINTVSDSFS